MTLAKSLSNRFASLVAVLVCDLLDRPHPGASRSRHSAQRLKSSRRGGGRSSRTPPWPSNYQQVLFGSSSQGNLVNYFINSLGDHQSATIAPLAIATMAAYAFSFMKWRGRDWVFIVVSRCRLSLSGIGSDPVVPDLQLLHLGATSHSCLFR